jgi:glutamate synthase (NADPH) large chain
VYDRDASFPARVNPDMVDLDPLEADDIEAVHDLVSRHLAETGSTVAERLLAVWQFEIGRFVKVMPRDFKRVAEAARRAEAEGRSVDEAVMEAAHG